MKFLSSPFAELFSPRALGQFDWPTCRSAANFPRRADSPTPPLFWAGNAKRHIHTLSRYLTHTYTQSSWFVKAPEPNAALYRFLSASRGEEFVSSFICFSLTSNPELPQLFPAAHLIALTIAATQKFLFPVVKFFIPFLSIRLISSVSELVWLATFRQIIQYHACSTCFNGHVPRTSVYQKQEWVLESDRQTPSQFLFSFFIQSDLSVGEKGICEYMSRNT